MKKNFTFSAASTSRRFWGIGL